MAVAVGLIVVDDAGAGLLTEGIVVVGDMVVPNGAALLTGDSVVVGIVMLTGAGLLTGDSVGVGIVMLNGAGLLTGGSVSMVVLDGGLTNRTPVAFSHEISEG